MSLIGLKKLNLIRFDQSAGRSQRVSYSATRASVKMCYVTRFLSRSVLKEYFEIVGEGRPLLGFLPHMLIFFTEMHF